MECSVTYSESYGSLMQCKGAESWARFHHAAVIKQHRQILDLYLCQQVNRISLNRLCSTKLQVEHRRHCIASKHLGQMKGIRKSSSLLLKVNTNMSSIISEISGICAKDLLSSEARYHSSNDAFVRIVEM